MLVKLFRITDEDSSSIAFDWVVLAAGILSLGMALTLTAAHHANAAPSQETVAVTVVSNAY